MATTPTSGDSPLDTPETLAADAAATPVVADLTSDAPSIVDTPTPYAGATTSTGSSAGTIKDQANAALGKVRQEAVTLKGQATDKARQAANDGKERAASALDDVVRMIEEAADAIDDKVGGGYGDYARRASETVAGFSSTIRDQNVDDLFDDVTDFARRSPGVAIGGAALIGFLFARLLKAGTDTAPARIDA